MAMEPCRECGEQISDQAKVCPKCGHNHPIISSFEKSYKKYPGRWLCAIFAILLMIGISDYNDQDKKRPQITYPTINSEEDLDRAISGVNFCDQLNRSIFKWDFGNDKTVVLKNRDVVNAEFKELDRGTWKIERQRDVISGQTEFLVSTTLGPYVIKIIGEKVEPLTLIDANGFAHVCTASDFQVPK